METDVCIYSSSSVYTFVLIYRYLTAEYTTHNPGGLTCILYLTGLQY